MIDLIYTNSTNFRKVMAKQAMDSDHALILVTKECRGRIQAPQYREVRIMANYSKDELIYVLCGMSLDDILLEEDPEQQILMLTAALNAAIERMCPVKVIKEQRNHNRWLSGDLKILIKNRNKLFSHYNRYRHDPNPDMVEYSHQCLKEYRVLRNRINREIPRAKKSFYKQKMDDITDSKSSWASMNEAMGRNTQFNDPITIIENGEEIQDPTHRNVWRLLC